MTQHACILDAAVIAENTSNDPGDCVLRAYITLQFECDLESIFTYARSCMPRHAVPETIDVLPTIPLTSGGKVDRLELSAHAALG